MAPNLDRGPLYYRKTLFPLTPINKTDSTAPSRLFPTPRPNLVLPHELFFFSPCDNLGKFVSAIRVYYFVVVVSYRSKAPDAIQYDTAY